MVAMSASGLLKRYLGEITLAGNDGVVTTFAVVSGFSGAALFDQNGNALKLSIGLVLLFGLANLFSDGLSMGIGNYLARSAEVEAGTLKESKKHVYTRSIATFLSFLAFGLLPLLPYMFGVSDAQIAFFLSIAATVTALLFLGFLKWIVVRKSLFRALLETVVVGGVAAVVAFSVGVFLRV
jgi:VIT1/CCC1 family predicted Fe2+/Mn2+ transporter